MAEISTQDDMKQDRTICCTAKDGTNTSWCRAKVTTRPQARRSVSLASSMQTRFTSSRCSASSRPRAMSSAGTRSLRAQPPVTTRAGATALAQRRRALVCICQDTTTAFTTFRALPPVRLVRSRASSRHLDQRLGCLDDLEAYRGPRGIGLQRFEVHSQRRGQVQLPANETLESFFERSLGGPVQRLIFMTANQRGEAGRHGLRLERRHDRR